jgi:hypothetical protein
MTRAGRSFRVSLYHRNLTLGVMQTFALLQLMQELYGASDNTRLNRRSMLEVARNASRVLRRVRDGRGVYNSMLLRELVSKRDAIVLEANRQVASPQANEAMAP